MVMKFMKQFMLLYMFLLADAYRPRRKEGDFVGCN